MSTITLEQITQRHNELGKMIAALQAAAPRTLVIDEATIELAPGERYAGLLLADDGTPSHHLILLPGEAEGADWQAALDWAKTTGGELPTRCEQSLLFANLKSEFQSAWYWSGEQYSADYAYLQLFSFGSQYYDDKGYKGRARAVRRLSL